VTQQHIVTTPANSGLGDSPKAAFDKCESNFTELYSVGSIFYPQTAAEIAAGVVPSNFSLIPGDINRYASSAAWSAVYSNTNTSARYTEGWRVDHAQHPTATNAIAGFLTYDDSQLTGTVGWHCTAFGVQALQFNGGSVSAGGTNSAFGYAAMQHNVEGSGNSVFGAETLTNITGVNSAHNNFFGYRGGVLMTLGTQNNSFGFVCLTNLLIGNNNHCFGESNQTNLIYGNGNQSFGYQALFNKTYGDFSHAFGYQSCFNETAAIITGISGAASAVVTVNTVSPANPFLVNCPIIIEGIITGMTQINGVQGTVTATGGVSGAWTITTNINSSGFTAWSAGGGVSSLGNTAYGYQSALNNNFGGGNTVMGWQAGSAANLGIFNTLVGYQAGNALNANIGGNFGSFNVAMGWQALLRGTSCSDVVAIGQQAANNITTGSENVVIGPNAGQGITTQSSNTWIGSVCGVNLGGNNNTGCGFNSGSQGSPQTFTNTQSFGANAVPSASNQVTLGDASIATLRCQQTTITALSDERFKKNIAALELPDGFLDEVQIVTFEWLANEANPGPQVGVIAQQLDAIQTKYGVEWLGLVSKVNPDRWEATPGKLLFPLIQRVQKQEARLKAIENRLGLLVDEQY
jgi:hypothetical protein